MEPRRYRWLRWGLAIGFAVIGVGGVFSNSMQKTRDKEARQRLQDDVAHLKDEVEVVNKRIGENRSALVGMTGMALAVSGQELKPNIGVPFFVSYVVTVNTARNLRSYQEVLSVKGEASDRQTKNAHKEFLARAVQHMDYSGSDFPPGTGLFRTLTLTLQSQEISELLAPKAPQRTVYIMSRVEWKNVSGSDDHIDICGWMEQPKMKYLLQADLPFHACHL